MPLPGEFSKTVRQVEASQQRYYDLARERRVVRRTYMGLLLLLTMLVLFVTTWLALFLSKIVTRPLAALAEATQEISRGRLDYRVDVSAADEIGDLVRSFNRMAEDLEASRRQIEASSRDLSAANAELDHRRRQMETILESIPTGVLSLDAGGASPTPIKRCSACFSRTEDTRHQPDSAGSVPGRSISCRSAGGFRAAAAPRRPHGHDHQPDGDAVAARTLSTSRSPWRRSGIRANAPDMSSSSKILSDLLKAQKQAAWREVARRVAHEIKNPLTPIALSAERIQRHLDRATPADPASLAVIRSCAATIAGAVETVRRLVDEFSTLARFPVAHPQPADINEIIENALSMFNGRLDGIQLHKSLASDLPKVMADAKRSNAPWPTWSTTRPKRCRTPWCARSRFRPRWWQPRCGGDHGRRHRPRRDPRTQRKTISSLFFDEETRHRPRPGHCEPRGGGPSRFNSRRREPSGRHSIHH